MSSFANYFGDFFGVTEKRCTFAKREILMFLALQKGMIKKGTFDSKNIELLSIKRLFKHTAIYGLATVMPRVLNLVLTPLHTSARTLSQAQYGLYQGLFAYMILGNVLLTYGMETAFFRFMNKEADAKKVASTSLTSLMVSSLAFLVVGLLCSAYIAQWLSYPAAYIRYAIWILALDTLVAIPFAWLRNSGQSLHYSLIKIGNVVINLGLNLLFLLYLPYLKHRGYELPTFSLISDKTQYIFMANLIASLLTFVYMLPLYRCIGLSWDRVLWQRMLRYAFPILVAGIAFSVNEAFDRVFIRMLYPADQADAVVGLYAGCYKMGVFMTLFITAYKLGVEPFFFSNATDKNAPATYAKVTEYFCIFAGGILLFVCIYIDQLKWLLIPNKTYWEGLKIVPFVLMANLCLGLYHSMSVWYKVTDRTYWGALISVVGGVITVVANLSLIPLWGYMGAAVATFLAYGGMMVLSGWLGQRYYPVPYHWVRIGGFLGLSVALSLLYFYVLDRNIWIGSGLFALYAIVAIKLVMNSKLTPNP